MHPPRIVTIGQAVLVAASLGCTDASLTGPRNSSATNTVVDPVPTLRILIDASRDGGVWWFPQTGPFDPDLDHQGKALADYLRRLDYPVRELGWDERMTGDLAERHDVVIRVGRYGRAYTTDELEAYREVLEHDKTLILLNDHLQFDWGGDELADLLGIEFEGVYDTTVLDFAVHPLTDGVTSLAYIVGSKVTIHDTTGVIPLAWLPGGELVMGVIDRWPAKVFFLGEVNGIELLPQPLVDNLIAWGF